LLHSYDETTGQTADPETALIPRLDAKEVAAVFTARFYDFLRMEVDFSSSGRGKDDDVERPQQPGDWYQGSWTTWHESDWRSMSCPNFTNASIEESVSAFLLFPGYLIIFESFCHSFCVAYTYSPLEAVLSQSLPKLTEDQQCITSTSPYPRKASPNPDPNPNQ
jgi:hypothetical protein